MRHICGGASVEQRIEEHVYIYEKEFYPFSNFSAFAFRWRDILWMTAEHPYQWSKITDDAVKEMIRTALSPHDAKMIAKAHRHYLRSDWDDETKLSTMEDILRAKHAQHPYISGRLIATGDRIIIEDSPTDAFWGWGPDRQGKNHLGKIWMRFRDELRAGR